MECQICYEIFDSQSIIPKILTNCGHSFCKICIERIINKKTLVSCPVCRERTIITQKESLPTNYSLIKIIEKNNEDLPTKNLLEKYKYFEASDFKYLNQDIIRNSDPVKLKLKRIVDNNLIYVEEFENNQNVSVFTKYAKRNRRYCFNRNSWFYPLLNEYSYSIFVFRKSSKCKHNFSCLESILRYIMVCGGFALLAKYPLQYLFERFTGIDKDLHETYINYARASLFGLTASYKIFKCLVTWFIDELTSLSLK